MIPIVSIAPFRKTISPYIRSPPPNPFMVPRKPSAGHIVRTYESICKAEMGENKKKSPDAQNM